MLEFFPCPEHSPGLPPQSVAALEGHIMGACFDPATICIPSLFVGVTFAFLAATPFAAARLLVLRMRAYARSDDSASMGALQLA